MAILYPTSLANLVVEVGTRHCHQTLLAKRPLKTNGRLANRGLTSLVKEATVMFRRNVKAWLMVCSTWCDNTACRHLVPTLMLAIHTYRKRPRHHRLNTLRPRQNGRRLADDVFKCIFLSENVWILIKISLKFVPRGPINNIPSLVWRRLGDKPLSETMMVKLPMHICVTRSQWVNTYSPRHLNK